VAEGIVEKVWVQNVEATIPEDQFKKIEDEYFLLKGQVTAGRITQVKFETALKVLMVQDAPDAASSRAKAWTIAPICLSTTASP
jgi:hypothetical protein